MMSDDRMAECARGNALVLLEHFALSRPSLKDEHRNLRPTEYFPQANLRFKRLENTVYQNANPPF